MGHETAIKTADAIYHALLSLNCSAKVFSLYRYILLLFSSSSKNA